MIIIIPNAFCYIINKWSCFPMSTWWAYSHQSCSSLRYLPRCSLSGFKNPSIVLSANLIIQNMGVILRPPVNWNNPFIVYLKIKEHIYICVYTYIYIYTSSSSPINIVLIDEGLWKPSINCGPRGLDPFRSKSLVVCLALVDTRGIESALPLDPK